MVIYFGFYQVHVVQKQISIAYIRERFTKSVSRFFFFRVRVWSHSITIAIPDFLFLKINVTTNKMNTFNQTRVNHQICHTFQMKLLSAEYFLPVSYFQYVGTESSVNQLSTYKSQVKFTTCTDSNLNLIEIIENYMQNKLWFYPLCKH